MGVLAVFLKDPSSILDYGQDWSSWLEDGETLVAADWTVPSGLSSAGSSFDASRALVWLSGGTDGEGYTVTCRVTTSGGRTDERSFRVKVRNR